MACRPGEREVPAEHSRLASSSSPMDQCGCPATYIVPFCWLGWLEPCSYSVPVGPQGSPSRAISLEEASLSQKMIDRLAPSSTPRGHAGVERVLLQACLDSTSSWLWEKFSGCNPKAGKPCCLFTAPISFCVYVCVLFQAHPQLKFALKVSYFHSCFSKTTAQFFRDSNVDSLR